MNPCPHDDCYVIENTDNLDVVVWCVTCDSRVNYPHSIHEQLELFDVEAYNRTEHEEDYT